MVQIGKTQSWYTSLRVILFTTNIKSFLSSKVYCVQDRKKLNLLIWLTTLSTNYVGIRTSGYRFFTIWFNKNHLPRGGEAGKSFPILSLTRNRPPKYGVSAGPSRIASTDVISLSSRRMWIPSNGSCFKFCTSLAKILISWGFRFSTLDTMAKKLWVLN